MPITWDELQKNGTDSRTIEQYIDDKEDQHNADQQAHMEAGASLANHREDNTLDHPARSVVIDKPQAGILRFHDSFEGIHGLSTDGPYRLDSRPGIILGDDGHTKKSAFVEYSLHKAISQKKANKSYRWQVCFKISDSSHVNFCGFGAGGAEGLKPSQGYRWSGGYLEIYYNTPQDVGPYVKRIAMGTGQTHVIGVSYDHAEWSRVLSSR